jgi:hypothetical protein
MLIFQTAPAGSGWSGLLAAEACHRQLPPRRFPILNPIAMPVL